MQKSKLLSASILTTDTPGAPTESKLHFQPQMTHQMALTSGSEMRTWVRSLNDYSSTQETLDPSRGRRMAAR